MKPNYRTPSNAVTAGTEAGLRHLNRVYVAKVNAMIAEDRTDVAQDLADDYARITDQEPSHRGSTLVRSMRELVGLSS